MSESATAATLDRPRDGAGRFVSTQTADADAGEAAAEDVTDSADQVEQTEASAEDSEADRPAGETTADTEAAPPEATAEGTDTAEATSTADDPVAEPFSFRADGADFVVEGATVTGDVITLSRDAWQRHVQPQLADRRAWERERNRLQRQVAERDPERNETVVQARSILAKLDAIQQAYDAGDEQPLIDFVQQFGTQFAGWKREAELEFYRARHQESTRQTEAETREQDTAVMRDGLRQQVDAVLATDPFKSLGFKSDDVATKLWALHERGAAVFIDLRDPAKAAQHNVEPDIYVDLKLVQEYLEPIAQVKREAAQRQVSAEKKTAAARTNAAVLQGGGNKPQPVVTAKGSPEPSGTRRPDKFKDKAEYDAYMLRTYGPT